MGARRHGQGLALAPPPCKCCQVFCALVFTVKRSVDQLFRHYFQNFSLASRGFTPRSPHQCSTPAPRLGTFVSRPPVCPPLEKILRAPMQNLYCLQWLSVEKARRRHVELIDWPPVNDFSRIKSIFTFICLLHFVKYFRHARRIVG